MAVKIPKISDIPEEERTPLVLMLLEALRAFQEENQKLKDEIARLKGQNQKPKIKPSKLEGRKPRKPNKDQKRPGSAKRKKTPNLKIHDTKVIAPEKLPTGSRFKEYKDFVVQNLVIKPHNIRYRLERWIAPDGTSLTGRLPIEIGGDHFAPELKSFVLYQYYHAHVTQPLLLEQLHEWGIDISSGHLNRMITEGYDRFHDEKDAILSTGLSVSKYIHVDDTGARHQGKNGYCTHIGNELFATFHSTQSKSRINFLEILGSSCSDYVINPDALAYMASQGLPKVQVEKLAGLSPAVFENFDQWQAALQSLNFELDRHYRIATEGALLGRLAAHGFNPNLVIVSDDAGQFNILNHALCWIHAERTITKLSVSRMSRFRQLNRRDR